MFPFDDVIMLDHLAVSVYNPNGRHVILVYTETGIVPYKTVGLKKIYLFCRHHFFMHYCIKLLYYLDSNFAELCPKGPIKIKSAFFR